jgi:hypothetical protein
MRRLGIRRILTISMLGALAFSACGKPKPPTLTQVEGTILLDDKPLPFAQVEFQPNLPKFGAEYNSYATTDENGHFQMICAHMQQPGAAVGTHRVLVSEQPTPAEYRSQDGETQQKYMRYLEKLQNRPIPVLYAAANTTPLSVEVAADKKSYDLRLSR